MLSSCCQSSPDGYMDGLLGGLVQGKDEGRMEDCNGLINDK